MLLDFFLRMVLLVVALQLLGPFESLLSTDDALQRLAVLFELHVLPVLLLMHSSKVLLLVGFLGEAPMTEAALVPRCLLVEEGRHLHWFFSLYWR